MKGNVVVKVSSDCMKATICINSNGNEEITEAYIRQQVEAEGIKAGIDEDVVRTLTYRGQYGMEYIVAQGKLPEVGHDGYYEYFFDLDKADTAKPNQTPLTVKKGEVLAEYHPVFNGTYGYNVLAAMVAPKPCVDLPKLQCLNVKEIDNKYIATDAGQLAFDGKHLAVLKRMEITGKNADEFRDIDFEGNLHIDGDVEGNITIRATGDIEIDGVVGGATLIAGNDIRVKYGVHGQFTSVIDAQGIVEAGFIEEATVRAKKLIRVDSMIATEAYCDDTIVAMGKTGEIRGCSLVAGRCVDAMKIRSDKLAYSSISLQTEDEDMLLQQTFIVREQFTGKNTVTFGKVSEEIAEGSSGEYHLTDEGIKRFDIGKYTFPKKKAKEKKLEKERTELSKPKILLVDDDLVILKKEYEDLCDKYRVTAIAKPIEALLYLKKKKPDLILLDYMMPEMNGTKLLEKIREIEGCEQIPVYFLTGISSGDVVRECLSMVPQGYLLKPMSKEEINKVVGDFFKDKA